MEWAGILHNCMAGYADRIESGQSVIYGIFREDKLCYAVEIRDGDIIQYSGKYNSEIGESDRDTIIMWHTRHFKKA